MELSGKRYKSSTAKTLFKKSAPYLALIEAVLPIAAKHQYSFYDDNWFRSWSNSPEFDVETRNRIIALELIDKAHWAAVTALLRAQRWTDAVCAMYEQENFLGWSAAFRAFLESAGDVCDGLIAIPLAVAEYHSLILRGLKGERENMIDASDLEKLLDHFVHAKWTPSSRKDPILTAKSNIDYVRTLEAAVPNVASLWHRLCGITHPSNASLEYFIDGKNAGPNSKLSLVSDADAMAALLKEYPDALEGGLMMHSNPPLLILRVLHAFGHHPQLKPLRQIDLTQIGAGAEILRALKRQLSQP